MFGFGRSAINKTKNEAVEVRKSRLGKRALIGSAVAVLAAAGMFFYAFENASAAGTISGTVYIDYNMNGSRDTTGVAPNLAVDKGIAGVAVTVYDSSGTVQGTDTSAANGGYSVAATGTGPYRIEFGSLAGYMPSTVGSNNDSAVQFVPDGNSTGIEYGVISAKEYCQNNPELATTCFSGTVTGNSADPVLLSFPYISGTTSIISSAGVDSPSAHTLAVQQNQFGSVWGLAYHRPAEQIFASAFTKRHAGFRNNVKNSASSDPTGEIFISNKSGSTASLFLNLNTLFGSNIAGNNPHDTADYETDSTAFDAVGKTSFGDMDISDDGQTLYVTNLQDRNIYAIPLGSGTPTAPTMSSQVTVYDLAALMNPGTAANDGCPVDGSTPVGEMNLNLRPGALKFKDDRLYVGLTCTAQSTNDTNDLRAYVYEMNPAGSGSAIQVANFALDYPRGCASDDGTTCAPAEWQPWTNNVLALFDFVPWSQKYYPQPWLTDIEFDQDEFMMLGVADRLGHQTGNAASGANTGTVEGVSAGETLRMYKNGAAWALESNANDNTNTTSGTGTGEGPGGGEFYYQDGYTVASDTHSEIGLGGLLNVPGFQDIVVSAFDPAPTGTLPPSGDPTYRAGGVIWLSNNSGTRSRSYQLFGIDAVNTFGKASGIGDLEAMCDTAPLQVGNRVWNDVDGDGVQDPGEAIFQNVAMELWVDTDNNGTVDTQIGTASTDVNGNYIFGGPGNTNLATTYCSGGVDVRVNASSDDAEQNVSDGSIFLTGVDLDFFSEEGSTPYYSPIGVRFNGVSIPAGATVTNAYLEFTSNDATVSAGNPAITIEAQDADNPGTFTAAVNDISGRPRTSSLVWNPPIWTNSSIEQSPDLSSIVQQVVNRGGWADGNSMVFILSGAGSSAFREAESFDGSAGEAPRLIVNYTVPGSCAFEILPGTAYEVRVASSNYGAGMPLFNFVPTSADADPSANGDSRDSDGNVFPGNVVKAQFSTGAYGDNDHTFDFGFRAPGGGAPDHSIGNRVWYDTNNDGVIDPTEIGISGISVSLFLDSGGDGVPDTPGSPVNTVTTDANGYYRFDSLPAETYLVRINPSNFGGAAKLEGHQNTTGNNAGDMESFGAGSNAENGMNPTVAAAVLVDGILSNPITLSATNEPAGEADVPSSGLFAGQGAFDDFADMTVDFGFYCLSLSGTVWNDSGAGADNDDGELDVGESLLSNYNVRVFDSAGNEIPVGPDGKLGTADDANGGMVTNGSGNYLFECLPEGDYRVVLDASGAASSGPTESDPGSNGDDNDNGYPDDTALFPGMLISGIVTLTPGDTGVQTNNVVDSSVASTSDPTVDFGVVLSPTMVRFDHLSAYFKGEQVVLEWRTGRETDNLGFNIYRLTKGGSELINASPVAGSALRTGLNLSVSGQEYRWIDRDAKPGSRYYIEDIDLNGTRTLHGPIEPKPDLTFKMPGNSSVLLSELGSNFMPNKQKETIEFSEIELESVDHERQKEIAAKRGAKIVVRKDGFVKVSFERLEANGFDTGTNTANWKLFNNGIEVPFKVGIDIEGRDAIGFYGKSAETRFGNESVYFLFNGDSTGKRIEVRKETGADGEEPESGFGITVSRKFRSLYVTSILNGEDENWFGNPIMPGSESSNSIVTYDPDPASSRNSRLRVRLQGLSIGQHLVSIGFNGTQLGTVELADKQNREFDFDIPNSSLANGENEVTLQSVGNVTDVSLIDEISIKYTRRYVARSGTIKFTVPADRAARIGGFENEALEIYQLDGENRVLREIQADLEKVGGTHGFSIAPMNEKRVFVAFESSSVNSGTEVSSSTPSKWNRNSNEADMVIIAPNEFEKPAHRLVRLKKAQGIETKLVFTNDIYDEYNFGVKSDLAIKRFLADTQNWASSPQFVILFGDSSYDMRNYLGQFERDLVPTRLVDTNTMETASDGWFADFDGDGVEDIAIGRLPASNFDEADRMVSKLERYEEQSTRGKPRTLLLADTSFEAYSDSLESIQPNGVSATKLNRSAMPNSEFRQGIFESVSENPVMVTYTGHGSTGIWAGTGVFGNADALSLENNKLAFFMLMTCLNGFTHNADVDSIGESLFKAENGAVAVWASSGTTYAADQFALSSEMTEHLFAGKAPIGELVRQAKYRSENLDVRLTWNLIGDPSTMIK